LTEQLSPLLGLNHIANSDPSLPHGLHSLSAPEKLLFVIEHVGKSHPLTTTISLTSLAVLIFFKVILSLLRLIGHTQVNVGFLLSFPWILDRKAEIGKERRWLEGRYLVPRNRGSCGESNLAANFSSINPYHDLKIVATILSYTQSWQDKGVEVVGKVGLGQTFPHPLNENSSPD
jgi:hypothetical protein